jgi:FeS assembly SUF system regulator
MLRISKLADYGTIILTAMAAAPQWTFSAAELGVRTGLPQPSVSKILKVLLREGIVVSLRGANGGYKLARAPAEISTVHILAALDGPLGLTECSASPGLCKREGHCGARTHWHMVNRIVLQALEQITLQHMLDSSRPRLDLLRPAPRATRSALASEASS